DAMKQSGQDLQKLDWFSDLWARARDVWSLAFLGGVALSFVTQSVNAVILLDLGMVQNGLLGAEAAAMVIYGAHLGNTLFRMLLSGGMKGVFRQVAGFQDVFKIVGTLIFVALFYLEVYGNVPLLFALIRAAANDLATQLAILNLFYNVSLACTFTLAAGP